MMPPVISSLLTPMHITATVSCPIDQASFRVQQVAGMFGLDLQPRNERTFAVELPGLDEDWQIGLIVGPSGSGKSTVAKAAFGASLYEPGHWPTDCAVIDAFPASLPTRAVVQTLTAVGFSSPPAWLRPYHVLSVGERFRCDLARALLGPVATSNGADEAAADQAPMGLVVFDEYTSTVDRTVAQVGSAAVAKAIGQGSVSRRFVAVTCHDDVAAWLQPEWTLDMATGQLARGRLRRPRLELELVRCQRAAWRLFAPHHYLSEHLNRAARCYLALLAGRPVAMAALLASPARRGTWRVSRIVVLPDFQGLGIGGHVLQGLGQLYREHQQQLTITTSHPAMIRQLDRSPHWRVTAVQHGGYRLSDFARRKNFQTTSAGRTVVSAAYSESSA